MLIRYDIDIDIACRLMCVVDTVPWTVSGNYARDETAFVFSLSDGKDRPPKQCTQVY